MSSVVVEDPAAADRTFLVVTIFRYFFNDSNTHTVIISFYLAPVDYQLEENCSIEMFVGHGKGSRREGGYFLMARWKGFGELGDTWEPLGGLNTRKYPHLLAEYAASHKDIQIAAVNLGLLY
jgi:hypothetical protein